jgi:hydroxypyruvate reductase
VTGALDDPRRTLLLDLYHAALSAVDGRRRVRAALGANRDAGPVHVLAIGKAAPGMTLGALDALGPRLARALVIAPDDSEDSELRRCPRITSLPGGHPLPDARSLEAGRAAQAFAEATPPGNRVLLLISGGASALFEIPRPGVTLDDLRRLNKWALSSAVDIVSLNAMRSALSLVKAGHLPGLFQDADVEGLMISDVPGDDPSVVGSGLLAAPRVQPPTADWPDWLRGHVPTTLPGDVAPAACRVTLIGCLDDALDGAERAARLQGLVVWRAPARLAGDAEAAARSVCHELAVGGADLRLWGGETVVRLPARAGRGGRCQHLALAAAQHVRNHAELVVLAASTDGRDGASDDAGAIIDGGTLARAQDAGYEAARSLATADSGSLLEAAGDLIHTGPTGTNVGDIVMGLRMEPERGRHGRIFQ